MTFMIFLQVFLIGLNAIFACAEIAVISMNDNKLAKMASQGDKRAMRLARLTSQPARFLATIQVAITLSGFLGSAFAAENFSEVLVNWVISLGVNIPTTVLDSIAVVAITIILSYFTLVFGELVPKQVAMRKAEPLALGLSGLISGIATAFSPIVSFLTFSTNTILRLLGIDPNAVDDEVSEEEIRMMVDAGSEKGTIDEAEKEFIQNVFEFDDLLAEDIVTHRTDVVFLDLEDTMDEWKETIQNSRYTLYPVCDGSADNIVGVLDTKEYFRLDSKTREEVMAKAVDPAYYVPYTVKADTLFANMKKDHEKLAFVLDEYGGLSGIVTINDLVEMLVGEIDDSEDEDEEIEIKAISEDTWMILGGALLEDVSEELGITIDCENYETFSGFVLHELGSIPRDGQVIEIEAQNLHISNATIKEHQVESAIVRIIKVEETEENKKGTDSK